MSGTGQVFGIAPVGVTAYGYNDDYLAVSYGAHRERRFYVIKPKASDEATPNQKPLPTRGSLLAKQMPSSSKRSHGKLDLKRTGSHWIDE